MLNHIIIMGRLVRDPELRYTQSQVPVASFTIACDRNFTNRDSGEKQTDFIDCVAWRSTAEFISKFFFKGSMAVVEGRLQVRNWEDSNGQKRRKRLSQTVFHMQSPFNILYPTYNNIISFVENLIDFI